MKSPISVALLFISAPATLSAQPLVPAQTFQATLKKIEGDKITLVRYVHPEPGREQALAKEETLSALAECKVLESRYNHEAREFESIPLEGGLKGDLAAKEFVISIVTVNRLNQIIEIRSYPRVSNIHQTIVTKIEGDKIWAKKHPFPESPLTPAPDCQVFEVRYVNESLPLVTTPLAGGLKSEEFTKGPVRVLHTRNEKNQVAEVCLLRPHPRRFEAAVKKIDGDKLTVVKHLDNELKGNEETLRERTASSSRAFSSATMAR